MTFGGSADDGFKNIFDFYQPTMRERLWKLLLII